MKRVVIIGGGYGGLKAAQWLAGQKNIYVTLIDKHKYHYLQTDAYDFIANKSDISDITLSLESFVAGLGDNLEFVNDEVIFINSNANEIHTKNLSIYYDYLIIATGSLTNFPSQIKGIKEFSNGVKTLFRALEFKQKFENTIFEFLKQSFGESSKKFNIVVGGAGLSGVEIAAEMAYIVEQYCDAIGIKNDSVSITLIEGSKNVLPGIHSNIVKIAQKRLDELGVILMLNSFISELSQDYLVLASGEVVHYDFMIFTGGIKARTINSDLEINLNRSNQIIVDEYFKVSSKVSNIFAIGDAAEISVRGEIVPSTAQSAEQAGIFCAKNILNEIAKKEMKKYEPRIYGMFVALGGKFGVGVFLNTAIIKGYKAYLLKKIIAFFYKLVLKHKIDKGYRKLHR